MDIWRNIIINDISLEDYTIGTSEKQEILLESVMQENMSFLKIDLNVKCFCLTPLRIGLWTGSYLPNILASW